MRPFLFHGLSALLLAALLAPASGACRSTTTSSTTAAPTTFTATDIFEGTITQSGTDIHSFTVSSTGTVTIALTSVAPLATMGIGVGIASWDSTTSTCGTTFAKNDNSKAGSTALTGTATAGNYCLQVYDSGNIAADELVTYAVQVNHY
jgi:hypothetical protein